MTEKEIEVLMAEAIKNAFINHPHTGQGTTWDQQIKSNEDSAHLAMAVMVSLKKAGLKIVPQSN